MLGKRLKYGQAKIIWDKTSKYDTNRMGRGTFLIAITIGNKNLLRKKLLNSNNINRKE